LALPQPESARRNRHYGGGEWYALDLDYQRIARILFEAGNTGYCCLEFEGKEYPDLAVARSFALLRKTIGA
jgi:L-ribulose-5-phosphate 3-epimerase